MKKFFRSLLSLSVIVVAIPAAAGYAIMMLWNAVVTSACGFAALTYMQAVGLFFLGQLLSAGFVAGLFLLMGVMHAFGLHPHHRGLGHWHEMSDEQRREFFERRRQWFHMMHPEKNSGSDGRE